MVPIENRQDQRFAPLAAGEDMGRVRGDQGINELRNVDLAQPPTNGKANGPQAPYDELKLA
jgi:hypothetical protein